MKHPEHKVRFLTPSIIADIPAEKETGPAAEPKARIINAGGNKATCGVYWNS